MLIGFEDKEKIKNIMIDYMKNNNITAYQLDKKKIISNKTLKKLLEDPNSKTSLTTVNSLNEKIPFSKSEKKIIEKILKKYEEKSKKNSSIKKYNIPSNILDTVKDTLVLVKETKDILEEIRIPIGINEPIFSKEENYFSKRKINCFNSDFDNRTLLITKIWELNNTILDKWKEVDLLLGINNIKDNKKIKKALITIANNLKEISFKLENASFDSDDISQEDIIIIKGEK